MAAYQSEHRVEYQTLKGWALESYFDGCRDLAAMKGWPHEQILGYVSYTFEDGFERPVENLMWQVILLVISGGWHEDWCTRQRQKISEQIVKTGLENLLVGVPADEAEVFLHDLDVLKLI